MTYDLKTIHAKSLMPGKIFEGIIGQHKFSAEQNAQVVNRL